MLGCVTVVQFLYVLHSEIHVKGQVLHSYTLLCFPSYTLLCLSYTDINHGDLKEVLLVLELYWFYIRRYICFPSNHTQLAV